MVIEFDSLEHALEEAQWCVDVYKTRHALYTLTTATAFAELMKQRAYVTC